MHTDEKRHYHFTLTREERETIVRSLGLAGKGKRAALARQIQREAGDDDVLALSGRLLRAWYYGNVRGIAGDVLEEILSGRLTDDEELDRYIHETVDGTDIVIYTSKAQAALLASDNGDAHEEETGEPAPSPEAAAYFALRADVLDQLRGMVDYPDSDGPALPDGFDLDDSGTWPANRTADEGLDTGTLSKDEV